MLERRNDSYSSERFNAIETFFKNAVSVVPLESLFYAIAKGTPEVMLQCCELLCGGSIPTTSRPSEFFLTGMEEALFKIRDFQSAIKTMTGFSSEEIYPEAFSTSFRGRTTDLLESRYHRRKKSESRYHRRKIESYSMIIETREIPELEWLLNDSINRIDEFLSQYKERRKERSRGETLCNIDLEVIYPSTEIPGKRECNMTYCKSPMTLLTEGKIKLAQLSEELIAEQCECAEEVSSSKTNRRMLTVLTKLRNEFETCSTLLGAFMESQVHIPLEKAESDNYVSKIAKHARSFSLSVWCLLILRPEYLKHMIEELSKDFGQFFIDFSRDSHLVSCL